MASALGTLMIDAFATGYYNLELSKAAPLAEGDEEAPGSGAVHMHADTHATHGHSHGPGGLKRVAAIVNVDIFFNLILEDGSDQI
ncbi:unnamed protein product [Victoria cruziana]